MTFQAKVTFVKVKSGSTRASVSAHVCCRQPEFSHGDRSCWWELTGLGVHVHPSVAAFAQPLLAGTYISYDGDPLRDLTLTAFLDKFFQRKAKV